MISGELGVTKWDLEEISTCFQHCLGRMLPRKEKSPSCYPACCTERKGKRQKGSCLLWRSYTWVCSGQPGYTWDPLNPFSYSLQQHDPWQSPPMGAYRPEERLNPPFPFHRPSSYSCAQRQTHPPALLRASQCRPVPSPWLWVTVGKRTLWGSAHPSCTSQSSAPCGDGAGGLAHRIKPGLNPRGTQGQQTSFCVSSHTCHFSPSHPCWLFFKAPVWRATL